MSIKSKLLISIYLSILLIATVVLLGYYLFIFRNLSSLRPLEENIETPVSVVICARNEEENLRQNLPLILNQDHPAFEVIVVNDASWDGTQEYLEEIQNLYSNLAIVSITESQKRSEGKKMALTLGFKKAKFDRFLLTDADCKPRTDKWIKHMTNLDSKNIVLGYGAYEKTKGLLNTLVRFDTWTIGIFYLSAASKGMPYMGVGRNLSYTRSIYNSCGGFRSHYHLASGDDDLFVNKVADARNTDIVICPESHTVSAAPRTWKKWMSQKKRHLSIGGHYNSKSKWLIGIYQFALLSFYTFFILSLCKGVLIQWVLIAFLLKTLIHLLISIYPSRELKEKDLLVLLPILEPLMLMLNLLFGIATLTRRNKAWK